MDPAAPPTPPRAVLFDAYGTLFDVYSVGLLAEQLFAGQGERLAVIWRDKQIEYTRLVSMSGGDGRHYRPFWELTRAGLRYAALRLGLVLDTTAEARLMNQYRHLSAFPENLGVLRELKARGIPAAQILFVSSNGWDAVGATWFGYTTLWVNRAGLPPEQLDTEPTRTGTSLRDVLSFFASPEPALP